MPDSTVVIAIEDPASPDAVWCVQRYYEELSARFDAGFDPGNSISADPEELTPPAGYFLIARLDGNPIGCGALKVREQRIGEIKRMWVSPDNRGLGVGYRLLESLEKQARASGLEILRLETNQSLKEAQSMYARYGYQEVGAFNDEPYAHHWFEKTGVQEENQ